MTIICDSSQSHLQWLLTERSQADDSLKIITDRPGGMAIMVNGASSKETRFVKDCCTWKEVDSSQ